MQGTVKICFFNEQREKAYGYEMLMQDAVRKMFIYLLRSKETETKNVPDRMLYAVN